MSAWLDVIGIGDDGLDGLAAGPRAIVEAAEVLIGGRRHLDMVRAHPAERLGWRFPLDPLVAEIAARRGRRVVVLATGDPFCFGIGTSLARHFETAEMRVWPAPSAFALARARLGWPHHTVEALSLHGRPFETVNAVLAPDQRVLLLSHDGGTPAHLAAHLVAAGWGASELTVLCHMGGPDESVLRGRAADWTRAEVPALNTIALIARADPGTVPWPRVPGLPDEAFRHDGQITKREVRAISLAALGPLPGQCLWDIGAGAGSIAIEWLRAAPNSRAMAIERAPERIGLIAENAAALGVPHLDTRLGEAPEALADLPSPNAVFIGGGLSRAGLLEAVVAALPSGGRLVANAVTLDGEARLSAARAARGGALRRIAIAHAEPLGAHSAWRPARPVVQWAWTQA